MDERQKVLLRGLPKIDELMLLLEKKGAAARAPRELIREVCRAEVAHLREEIVGARGGRPSAEGPHPPSAEAVADRVLSRLDDLRRCRLRPVINATGVILHTNLGRAPLCPEAVERIAAVSRGYANLEFDLERGERGLRYDHVHDLLCALTGAEDALVVNNNAAAVLLVLNTLAEGREAVVSRGELIEIGGEFRIPDVMEKSGGRLREVGTTNRTRLADYERAIGPETALILKVHTSNFRIVGFTEEANLRELVALGKSSGLPVLDDLGSGCLIPLERFGLMREPTVQEVLETGVDVVTFSGDKLLGGPQAGIILGGREILGRIKRNPLNRALRIDKLTLAALEATLIHYLTPEAARDRLRVLKALTEPLADVKKRAQRLLRLLRRAGLDGLDAALAHGTSMTGGGSLPTQEIPTALVALKPRAMSAGRLEERLRGLETPVVARIAEDTVVLDARTLAEDELIPIRDGLRTLFASRPGDPGANP